MLPKSLSPIQRRQVFTARQRRIFNFLSEHHTGVLSSITPGGEPHGVVMYYAIDDNFTIHVLTKVGTRKHDNLIHNSHVMLTVHDVDKLMTAQITGVATERSGNENIERTAKAVFGHLTLGNEGPPPIMKLQVGAFTTFEIKPVQIRMASYARPMVGGYKEVFDSIESFELKND